MPADSIVHVNSIEDRLQLARHRLALIEAASLGFLATGLELVGDEADDLLAGAMAAAAHECRVLLDPLRRLGAEVLNRSIAQEDPDDEAAALMAAGKALAARAEGLTREGERRVRAKFERTLSLGQEVVDVLEGHMDDLGGSDERPARTRGGKR